MTTDVNALQQLELDVQVDDGWICPIISCWSSDWADWAEQ
ncbi:ALQxL family class IV lanthipeptide [Kitasatospora sp. NBC_01539]